MLKLSYKSASQTRGNVAEHRIGVPRIEDVRGNVDDHGKGKHQRVYDKRGLCVSRGQCVYDVGYDQRHYPLGRVLDYKQDKGHENFSRV